MQPKHIKLSYTSVFKTIIASFKLLIDNKDKDRVETGRKNESFKFVGVHLDENLNWHHHRKSVKNKASSAVFALSSVKNILTRETNFQKRKKSHY